MSDETPAADDQPLVQVVTGHPSDDELAAVVAVISAKSAAPADPPEPAQPSTWAAYWRTVRTPLRPGPGAWRSSALPR
ncbi:acyl-CoA carboxylase subunit epsilon [Phytoactinopolyspora limicola]|uniref:acyl-CoA carboxylase subunit epsilon n=1 Tax=Phytoactinopolyspora limicola TaxID=2715536 RepID=UPI001408B2C1|nr:acyl-CoA carboxylase subunit epsilon [Phytoactinopolyspora limicola]